MTPTDLHRIFIQCLLGRRVMTQEVALEMYNRAIQVCQKVDERFEPRHGATSQGFSSFLGEIVSLLEEVNMTVKTSKEETGSGKSWVALVNTDATDIALMATDYTPIELTYIRNVIDNIIISYPVNSIGSTRALALTSDLKSVFPKSQAELVLASCVSRGWLRRSRRGRYALAMRSLMELEVYLKEQYADYVYTCKRCSKIVLTGVRCEADDCDAHIHESCLAAYQRRGINECPTCKTSFVTLEPSPLGEKAASRETDHHRSGPTKRRRGARGPNGADDDEEVELEDEPEDEEGMRTPGESQSQSESQSQTQSQSQSQSQRDTRDQTQTQPQNNSQPSRQNARPSKTRPTWKTSSASIRQTRSSIVPATQYDEDE